ncbi:hypothetical protein PR202_gb23023 [Eleusine coracana subsp. coracana]|uniref:Uncharacterized protein n=1 Tax=Eleusine coracana subsp. coracana TaxID=191504 RepID=A0AAV5FHB5_ELECO|nr:hypothetical protein PR202_gb23023 [Eleusine coracana subsp. coracana]
MYCSGKVFFYKLVCSNMIEYHVVNYAGQNLTIVFDINRLYYFSTDQLIKISRCNCLLILPS